MCGLAGILDLSGNLPPEPAVLAQMTGGLSHRGPDDAGVYFAQAVALAARRLSIVDVAGGHMPLANEDETVWITYNGEVYNAPAMREELRTLGHRFRTQGDTEVIVHAYEEWAEGCIERLRGMFALALWDVPRQRLLLARDRFGVKPLYYALANGRLVFASEIEPVLCGAGLTRSADTLSLAHLFRFGCAPSPHTMFAGVHSLPPAHLLVVDLRSGLGEPRRYWDVAFRARGAPARLSYHQAREQFEALLRDSVCMRLMNDVPIGALLSGGLDSSALVALLQELTGGRTATFSIGFDADSHDESKFARRAADHLHTDHHTLAFGLSDFALWPEVIRRMETPQCSATAIPIYMLYRGCHEAGYKVILTGEGADELLGGYHWFAGDARVRPWLGLPSPLRAALAEHLPIGSAAGRRVLARGTLDPVERFILWSEATTAGERRALRVPAEQQGSCSSELPAQIQNLQPAIGNLSAFDQFLYLESHTRLPGFINDEVDRMSMAHSVEARVPFLDHRLWEFTATLPSHFKLSAGVEKRLLRSAMKGRLPDSIRLRRKQGLAAPHALFWRQPRLPAFAADALGARALHETGYFDPPAVSAMLYAHRTGRRDHSRALTGVLTTQLWHAQFIR
jgi:asparagine synthase (glutamine-hydrolysing)